jgi:hypothetical protein
MTNAAIGTSAEMSATLLEGEIDTNVDTIGYSVTVGGVSVVASAEAATVSDPIDLLGTAGNFTISSHNIDITLVKTDYENAPADTYNASIYFNFVTI